MLQDVLNELVVTVFAVFLLNHTAAGNIWMSANAGRRAKTVTSSSVF